MAGQQKTFNIGQIIYILSNKSQSVVPAIVAEENTHKVRKLDGIHEVVNYKLNIGPKDRVRMVELSRIDGEVFESLDDIRENLVAKLTAFVDELVKTTSANVMNWYGVTANNQVLEQGGTSGGFEDKFDPEQLVHAVNHNLPLQSPQQQHPLQIQGGGMGQQQGTINPHAGIRENIRQMVTPEDEEMQSLMNGPTQQGQTFALLPDGTRVPVKLNG